MPIESKDVRWVLEPRMNILERLYFPAIMAGVQTTLSHMFKTKVTVQWIPADSATDIERKTFDEGRDGMKQGWGGTMDQFAAYLGQAK